MDSKAGGFLPHRVSEELPDRFPHLHIVETLEQRWSDETQTRTASRATAFEASGRRRARRGRHQERYRAGQRQASPRRPEEYATARE